MAAVQTLHFVYMQDQGLDMISEGLDTLKNMAHDMNEVSYVPDLIIFIFTLINILVDSDCCMLCYFQEIDRQVPLMDEIDTKVMISLIIFIYL